MNIIYIANTQMPSDGAHGTYAAEMCNALAEEGNTVELVVPVRRSALFGDPFAYYHLSRSFSIRYLASIDIIRWWHWGGRTLQYMSFALNAVLHYAFRSRRETFVITREHSIATLFSRMGFRVVFEALRVPRSTRRYFASLRRVYAIVSISESIATIFAARGFERVRAHSNGVRLARFQEPLDRAAARARFNVPSARPIALYAGNLEQVQGVETMIAAASLARGDALFVAAGGSALDVRGYRARLAREHIRNVIFHGHVENRLLPDMLRIADVLLLLNHRDLRDNAWVRLFEYMASGVPIVAFDTSGIRTVLTDETAILVPPQDPQALAEAASAVLQAPERFASMAKRAQDAATAHSWRHRARAVAELAR